MDLYYQYRKQRKNFGSHCHLDDVKAIVLETIEPSSEHDKNYILRNPTTCDLDTNFDYSEHEAGTEPVMLANAGVNHVEGGWPKDVDTEDADAKDRYRKKVEKGIADKDGTGGTASLAENIKLLGPLVDRCLRQNNTIDIYEEYFEGEIVEHNNEPPSAKGLAKFRDPSTINTEAKRTATSINWNPESAEKIAVSYSIMNFQDTRFMNDRVMPMESYLWDINNPNVPETTLVPSSPLCCLRYNKNPEQLVGGCYNGLITFFDIRKSGGKATETSTIETSHHDPVYDVFWVQSKTNTAVVSCSTDGWLLWWDVRRLHEPSERLKLDDGSGQVLGASSLAYNMEAGPTRYIVGTEQGCVMCVNMKRKDKDPITVSDRGSGRHHAPIYSIERNPIHTKFYLTVGDWSARLWYEDTKTPIMTTQYAPSYLTAGCWSPTRPGVFFTCRMDGVVDVWDYFYTQSEVAYSHKVGDTGLSSIAVQGDKSGGKLCAVGDDGGTVTLLELCDSLANPQPNEKQTMSTMFERETKREQNLEKRMKELKKRNVVKKGGDEDKEKSKKDEQMTETLRQVDSDFLSMVRESEDGENGNDNK